MAGHFHAQAAALILLLAVAPAAAVEIPDEATKVEALKLGYILNGNSMVRWGSIDLTHVPEARKPEPESAPVVKPKKGK